MWNNRLTKAVAEQELAKKELKKITDVVDSKDTCVQTIFRSTWKSQFYAEQTRLRDALQ